MLHCIHIALSSPTRLEGAGTEAPCAISCGTSQQASLTRAAAKTHTDHVVVLRGWQGYQGYLGVCAGPPGSSKVLTLGRRMAATLYLYICGHCTRSTLLWAMASSR